MTFQLPALPAVPARSLPVFLLSFSLGVISIRFMPWLPGLFWIAVTLGVAIVMAYRWPRLQIGLYFIVGLCLAGWHATQFQLRMIPISLEKKDLVATGIVSGLVTSHSRGVSFDFDVEKLEFKQQLLANPGIIRLTSYEMTSRFQSGERWQFVVRLKRPRSLVNPGMGFDYAAWLYSKGTTAKGYIVKGSAVSIASDTVWLNAVLAGIDQTRKGFAAFLAEQAMSLPEQSVFGALSVGIRDQMDADTWRVLRDTGTAHLVAISGLHVGLVALIAGLFGGLLWGLLGGVRRQISKPAARWGIGIVAAVLYAMLAGFPLPTQRAVTMLTVAALVVLWHRVVPTGWLLSIALSVVLILNPLAPLANSLWLSFIAVVILIFSFRNRDLNTPESEYYLSALVLKMTHVIKSWAQMQLWLFVGMVPVLLIGFQQISLVSPLANLVAVPVIGMLIVPLVLLSFVSWSLGLEQLASAALSLCSVLFEFIWRFLLWLSQQPLAIWQQGTPTQLSTVIALFGLLVLVFGRTLPWRWFAGIWLLPLFLQSALPLDREQFRYTVLDVGQGLASVIQTQNHTLVFDAGARYASGFDMGEVVVVPFLRSRSIREIDLLLISHGDNDHAGGAQAVISAFEINQKMAGDINSNRLPGQLQSCKAGQKWQWDGVDFAILWPSGDLTPKGNDGSCVLRVSSRFGSVLITGDIEKSTERRLLEQNRQALSADLLQIPHHGSLTSSTPDFIRAVNPQIALNSSGYLNRFGHPHETILKRYEMENIAVLTTAQQGAIEATFDSSGIHVASERARRTRFWRDAENSTKQFTLPSPTG